MDLDERPRGAVLGHKMRKGRGLDRQQAFERIVLIGRSSVETSDLDNFSQPK